MVGRIVKAYGGRDAIVNAHSVLAIGTIVDQFRSDSGRYARFFIRDGRKLRVETQLARSSEIRMLDGKRGWRGPVGQVVEVTGPPFLAMLYQYKQLDLPYGLMTGQYKIKSLGEEKIEGSPAKVLELNDSEGPTIKIWVSENTSLIVEAEGIITMPGGGKTGPVTSLRAGFSDFRKTGGVMMPYKITNYGSGGTFIGETTITKVLFDQPVADNVFHP
ncbi:MAG TPA: hypothetical protein VGK71_10310 [Nitrospirota bacterium]|jgi:hypothetical protein